MDSCGACPNGQSFPPISERSTRQSSSRSQPGCCHGARRDRTGSCVEESYLHRAALSRDNGAILSLLIEHGADVNALDEEGRTPFDRAIENGCKSNAKLLRSLGGKRS